MFNPAIAAEQIKKEYIGYISTTYSFKNKNLQNNLLKELKNTVSNGPFIEIKDSFKSGKSINQLIDLGVLSPLFKDIEKDKIYKHKLPLDRPLYFHQEMAIEKIVNGKNVVVSTGTGSGKTNCFIIPVINELLREKEQGLLDDGVRAIFIYPMNALANDQIKGLREILMSYPDIKFGVYNGGTENKESDAIKLYETMYSNEEFPELRKRLPNEYISREVMKETPPHILFTNYAMLEHLLFRPGDEKIFKNSKFKFVVLDEAHVYTGATGIETSFLIGRLKGRICTGENPPQFILTSATLGDGSLISNRHVVDFASKITGSVFNIDDIVLAYRDNSIKMLSIIKYPIELYLDLANEELFFDEVLKKYNLKYEYNSERIGEILYDILSSSDLYYNIRKRGGLIKLYELSKDLDITPNQLVSFIYLCAKARKNNKQLIDIRYHYFLRALDGCFLALDHEESLSLLRTEKQNSSSYEAKKFEIAVCDDCGEIAIVGQIKNNFLVRSNGLESASYFQIKDDSSCDVEEIDEYLLCKTCGAIVPIDESHNEWCTCGNTEIARIVKLKNDKCYICDGRLRRFNLGYDSATGVIATSLYEQIPEFQYEEKGESSCESNNIFLKKIDKKKKQIKKGSQFLIFSDSRQGAAKFACFLGDSYNEFLRRRGIWNVVNQEEDKYKEGICISDFVSLLENYYSSYKLFRKSNSDNETSKVETHRNAWVAILNELYNFTRSTSLLSLGRMSFEYLGNDADMVDIVSRNYNVGKNDAKNFLDYLAFEIVKTGAIVTDKDTDINDNDRDYLFYTPYQRLVCKNKDNDNLTLANFMPTSYRLKTGEVRYYKSNKLRVIKDFLNIDNNGAIKFLDNYWEYLISEQNRYKLETRDGKGFYMPARYISVFFGKNAKLWKCPKCGRVTQFNIKNKCIQDKCLGNLYRIDPSTYFNENYYALLYNNKKMAPLFVKEHTAQLAKKDALEYQQQFIRKDINALSCSTTFEMGVDVGDLETVFLRNIPPTPSNYAQRVGRAGRSIDAAAFALTFARLSSHDFNFFSNPEEMINGIISPPNFTLNNQKILKRHIYAIALSFYFRKHPELYNNNNAEAFINNKGYINYIEWLKSGPKDLAREIFNSIKGIDDTLMYKYINSFDWVSEFCGEDGVFTRIINEFESNISYLKKEYDKSMRLRDEQTASIFARKIKHYSNNDLIDFLVRGNMLPKYGFPIDSVELTQNITSRNFKTLNLNRDLSVAIAEYAPSSEVIADGGLYTSRYIRKPIINKIESAFEIGYIAECQSCNHFNYSSMPIGIDGQTCIVCGELLNKRDFKKSIEPRAGFIAEEDVKPVPLRSQEKKYKTEAIYIGDKAAKLIDKYEFKFNDIDIFVESTINDSLLVKSTDCFYVCSSCGYSISASEEGKLKKYEDYKRGVPKIEKTKEKHTNPFGRGVCENTILHKYTLHHEFKTDVAKISFGCATTDYSTMLSVMYALLNAFSNELNIEKRDIKACLAYKSNRGIITHTIIIYDAVPGGAGHSRRLVTEGGDVLKLVVKRAVKILETCKCSPSCYRCLRSYENQKVHEILDREKALDFLKRLI